MNKKKKFDVIVVGELNLDLILNQIINFPAIGKEVLADQMTITLGSSSAIFASNLRTLGSKVTYIGLLGQDSFGEFIISSLKSKGVDTNNIIIKPNYSTGATIVLNYNEDRAMITYPGAMSHLSIADISDESLILAKHLHVSSIFLQEGLKKDIAKLFKRAKELGLTTSLDPQWDPAEIWDINLDDLLHYTDVFIPNAAEIMALTNTDTLENAMHVIQHFNTVVIIKNSNKGASLCYKNKIIHQPAFLNRKVVDSIGAGDSFDAGVIFKYIQNKPLAECLEFGALIGAINTTGHGGTGAFENIKSIKSTAQKIFNYTF